MQQKKKALEERFRSHRKKAKVVFRNDAETAGLLAITGTAARTYITWVEAMKKFYTTANDSEEIKTKLATFKITEEDLTNTLSAIPEMEAARAEYLREKGESQEATRTKDVAIAALDTWMSDFYAVARIALEDQPQLLEALGKTVRS